MPDNAIDVLVVDDDEGDLQLTQIAFENAGTRVRLRVERDGEAALAHLRRCGPADRPLPDVILLDLNMPRMDGHEFLDVVKADGDLRSIPVVILTTSDSPADVAACYDRNAASYIRKPDDMAEFRAVIDVFVRYWGGAVMLPWRRPN